MGGAEALRWGAGAGKVVLKKRLIAILLAGVLAVIGGVFTSSVDASPAEDYTGTHFGNGNTPPGCEHDDLENYANNACHHMRTGLNGLDSPQVDVLILVPISPTAERDMRIMRQAVEMWEGGIHNLSPQMGLDWLGDGMQFHITVDYVDPNGAGGEFTTYPIVDPEVVVIATNPVGGVGIGIDPVSTVAGLANTFIDLLEVPVPPLSEDWPCHGVANPLDFEAWESLPGFNRHHEPRVGTYVEDCGGAGGNICFAINGGLDPVPGAIDESSLFDLVAHEVGHCLTIGHVGDGAEGAWGKVPTNDIMAYNPDPPGLSKCVSTLDVEAIAITMSNYLDVNGDSAVTGADHLAANYPQADAITLDDFQTQHPRDHRYASGTGAPKDCPQPDTAAAPRARTDWEPEPVTTSDPVLDLTSPSDGASSPDGAFDVIGSVEHVPRDGASAPTGYYDDADDDAQSPITEITELDVAVDASNVEVTMHLVSLPPSGTTGTSPSAYSAVIDGRRFDSFMRYPQVDPGPMTWDAGDGTGSYLPAGSSTWDTTANTVSFHIPRSYLQGVGIVAPYEVASLSNVGSFSTYVPDDHAPDGGDTVGVASSRGVAVPVPVLSPRAVMHTTTFEHEGGNTFYAEQSTLGVTPLVLDPSHKFGLDLPRTSSVAFTLNWTDPNGGTDLDLRITGAADSGSAAASDNKPETVTLTDVRGHLDIAVEPYLVTDEVDGSTYTLTAVITESQVVDTDDDGVPDNQDACPTVAGDGVNGCPLPAQEHVHVYVDGVKVASQVVDTTSGPATFAIPVTVGTGPHTLRIEWQAYGRVLATKSLNVSGATGTPELP